MLATHQTFAFFCLYIDDISVVFYFFVTLIIQTIQVERETASLLCRLLSLSDIYIFCKLRSNFAYLFKSSLLSYGETKQGF